MTKAEQETIVRFDATDEDAYLWTASPVQQRRWEKAGLAVESEAHGWRARCPKGWVRVRAKRRATGGGFQKREALLESVRDGG